MKHCVCVFVHWSFHIRFNLLQFKNACFIVGSPISRHAQWLYVTWKRTRIFSTRFAADFGACVMSFVLNYYMQFSTVVFFYAVARRSTICPQFCNKKNKIERRKKNNSLLYQLYASVLANENRALYAKWRKHKPTANINLYLCICAIMRLTSG